MSVDIGRSSRIDFGAIVRQQREARGLDIDGLCDAIGGTPGPGFLTSLEAGLLGPSSSLVLKLADVLGLPGDLMLNAAGWASQTQRALAPRDLARGRGKSALRCLTSAR